MFVFPLWVRFPLLDPDEGLHAAIAQEMVERGHWLTPSLLGKPFWDKPILYCWLQAASLRLLGPNEAAVRLPGLMFGLLGARHHRFAGLAAMGKGGQAPFVQAPGTDRRLVGPFRQMVPVPFSLSAQRTGLIAGILYATMILPTALAQAASHDVALVPWINLTLLCLWESAPRSRPAMRGGLSAGGRCGAGLVDPHQGTGRRGRGCRGLRRLPTAGVDIFHISNFKLEIGIRRWLVPSRAATQGSEPRPATLDPWPPFSFRSACLRAALVLSIAILVACALVHRARRAKPQLSLLLFYRSAPAGLRHGHAAARRPALVVLFAAVVGRRTALDRLSAGSRCGVRGRGPGVRGQRSGARGRRLEVRQA